MLHTKHVHQKGDWEQILVADAVVVHGADFCVHVPGSTGQATLSDLGETLGDLNLDRDEALQAFLSLPDVNALSENLLESFEATFAGSFHSLDDALRALSPLEDWENDLADWQVNNGVDEDALEWNYQPLYRRLRDVYDLVEWKVALHAFNK